MEIKRRAFLGTVGAGAAGASLGAAASASAAAAAPTPASGKWDLSWTERLGAKYRAVFDSTTFAGGAGLIRAVTWKHDYREVYGTPPEDMTAVLVVRAEAVWLAMDDAFWKQYQVGAAQGFKAREPGKFREANPVATTPAHAPPGFEDASLPAFMASGGIVLACHRAFGEVVALVKNTDKLASDDEAEKKALAFVLPGIVMQPSGIFAALRAQEAGCHYILAS